MDQDTKDRFENLNLFLNENMFTKANAEAMRLELADKEDLLTRGLSRCARHPLTVSSEGSLVPDSYDDKAVPNGPKAALEAPFRNLLTPWVRMNSLTKLKVLKVHLSANFSKYERDFLTTLRANKWRGKEESFRKD